MLLAILRSLFSEAQLKFAVTGSHPSRTPVIERLQRSLLDHFHEYEAAPRDVAKLLRRIDFMNIVPARRREV